MYCIVLYCIVLYCTILHCSVLYCAVLYLLYCIVLYCIVLYCIARNCGEMAATESDYDQAQVCASGSKILYAWAMDAPSLKLPKGGSL